MAALVLPGTSETLQEHDSWRNVLREEHQQLRNDQRRQLKEHASAVERMLQQQQLFFQRLSLSLGSRPLSPLPNRNQSFSRNMNGGIRTGVSELGGPLLARSQDETPDFDGIISGANKGSTMNDITEAIRADSIPFESFSELNDNTRTKQEDPENRDSNGAPLLPASADVAASSGIMSIMNPPTPARNSYGVVEATSGSCIDADPNAQRNSWCVPEDASSSLVPLTLHVPPHDPPGPSRILGPAPLLGQESEETEMRNQCTSEPIVIATSSKMSTVHSGADKSLSCSETTVDSYQIAERERAEWHHHMKTSITKQITRTGTQKARLRAEIEVNRIARFVERKTFSTLCATLILLNALFVGLDTDLTMRMALKNPDGPSEVAGFKMLHRCFNSFFFVELILRIFAYKILFFVGPEWRWNYFDALLVFISIIEEIVETIDLASLRVLRGVRMFRVLRLMRVMRFFRELRLMIYSIVQSFFALSWALVVLLILMYLFAIVFMQGTTLHLFRQDDADYGPRSAVFKIAKERYSTMFQTLNTLLKCITGGTDWSEVASPLGEISFLYELLFAFYITFVVIGVLNVLTGIFVERASELHGLDRDLVIQAELRRNESFFSEMTKIFEEADADGSHTISWEEFRDYLKNKEVRAYLATQQLDAYDARQLFNILDLEDGQEIGIEEFIIGCSRLRGLAKSVDVVALLREARQFQMKVRKHMTVVEDELDVLRHRVEGDLIYDSGRNSKASGTPRASIRPSRRESNTFTYVKSTQSRR